MVPRRVLPFVLCTAGSTKTAKPAAMPDACTSDAQIAAVRRFDYDTAGVLVSVLCAPDAAFHNQMRLVHAAGAMHPARRLADTVAGNPYGLSDVATANPYGSIGGCTVM